MFALKFKQIQSLCFLFVFALTQYTWAAHPNGSMNRSPQNVSHSLTTAQLEVLALSQISPEWKAAELGQSISVIEATLAQSNKEWSRQMTIGIAKANLAGDHQQADLLAVSQQYLDDVRTNLVALLKEQKTLMKRALQSPTQSVPRNLNDNGMGEVGSLKFKCSKESRSVASIPKNSDLSIQTKKPCKPILNQFVEKYGEYLPKFNLGCDKFTSCIVTSAIFAGTAFLMLVFGPFVIAVFVPAVVVLIIYSWYRELTKPADEASCYLNQN